jgi:hypothetical protein
MGFNFLLFGRLGTNRQKHTVRKRPSKVYLANKERARQLVLSRLEYFNRFYGFTWGRVAIKNTKRRWGSCSKKGNLNFNYRVALISQDLADYVLVHELCHLGQFNHSRAFWELVAKTLPDYKVARKKLKNVKL